MRGRDHDAGVHVLIATKGGAGGCGGNAGVVDLDFMFMTGILGTPRKGIGQSLTVGTRILAQGNANNGTSRG